MLSSVISAPVPFQNSGFAPCSYRCAPQTILVGHSDQTMSVWPRKSMGLDRTGTGPMQKLDFTALLAASGRSHEIPESADAYGWLIGSWELDCRCYKGVEVSIKGEAHFGWVL